MAFQELFKAVFNHPAIDNHAHPLLRVQSRNALPFEGIISEAEGEALIKDAIHTLACFRATKQLAKLFGLDENVSWEDIKAHRASMDYLDLCKLCFKDINIQCILIDDGLGIPDIVEDYRWHDQLTPSATRRIVRVEVVAEGILKELLSPHTKTGSLDAGSLLETFRKTLVETLENVAVDKDVVGFKSVVCYRTGMNVALCNSVTEQEQALLELFNVYVETGSLRLAHKPLNDEVVRVVLAIAGNHEKPVQFHTGLGDSDIILTLSSPAHLQPIIEAFPRTKIVLLHSSYPYTREAGYLTAVYENVFLDFGEVFPFVSGEGQRAIIRQVLEMSPTNKIMWSSDGHWWPESYYLGIVQARQALYVVLAEVVAKGEITEREAVRIVTSALFHTAKRVYGLDDVEMADSVNCNT